MYPRTLLVLVSSSVSTQYHLPLSIALSPPSMNTCISGRCNLCIYTQSSITWPELGHEFLCSGKGIHRWTYNGIQPWCCMWGQPYSKFMLENGRCGFTKGNSEYCFTKKRADSWRVEKQKYAHFNLKASRPWKMVRTSSLQVSWLILPSFVFSLPFFMQTLAEFRLWGILIFLEKLKKLNAVEKQPLSWCTPGVGPHFGSTGGVNAPPFISDESANYAFGIGPTLHKTSNACFAYTPKEITDPQTVGKQVSKISSSWLWWNLQGSLSYPL